MADSGEDTPQKVGQFELLERLATAPEGELYRARQPVLGRTVDLWWVGVELSADEAYKARFLDQAKRAQRLSSEHVVRLLDVGRCTQTERYFVVFEPGEGLALHTLRERRGGPLQRAEALELVGGVLEALAAAAEAELVHGDLRLEHVLVDPKGVTKLLHLGLAKQGPAPGAQPYGAAAREARGPQDDLYAAGVCLSLLATGADPARFELARAAHWLDDDLTAVIHGLLGGAFGDAKEALEALRAAQSNPVVRRLEAATGGGAPDIEATMLTPATRLRMTPKPDARPQRSASGRVQPPAPRPSSSSGRVQPPVARPESSPAARPEAPPRRTVSGRIVRGGGYYDVDPGSGEGVLAGAARPLIPALSLDDAGGFSAGWDSFLGKPPGDQEPAFHKITRTMERVPASFLLTLADAPAAESQATAPRMVLSDDMSRAYKVERELGKGGQGTVYKVSVQGNQRFEGFSKPVTGAAIKVSHDTEALLSEQAIYSIPNPGIIKLLDAGQIQGTTRKTSYIVVERLYPHPFNLFGRDGGRSPVDLATAIDTFVNLLLTVHELHFRKQLPLVLCDIKPDNLMVRMSGEDGTPSVQEYLRRLAAGAYEPVLLDMGCAQHHGELRKARGRMNIVIGTPLYMSPEVAPQLVDGEYQPGTYNAKQDVYSLTMTFLYHLTGARPYTHTGLYDGDPGAVFNELLAYKRDQVDPIDYDLLEQRVGSEDMETFVEILQRGLHPDPDHRAAAKVLFKECEKAFAVKEVRLRDLSQYFYDDIKGLTLSQNRYPRIRPDHNLYLTPDSAELLGPQRRHSRRISRAEMGLPRGGTTRLPRPSGSGRVTPPPTGRQPRPSDTGGPDAATERQRTGHFRRNSGSFRRPGRD